MSNVNFYINNILAQPDNAEDINIELSFENDQPDANIRTTTFLWKGTEAKYINDQKNSGLNGGTGILEGLPFKIEVCDPNLICYDGCIDPTTADSTFTCDIVRAGSQQTRQIDKLNIDAERVNFSALKRLAPNSPGKILVSDYIKIPYVISAIPDYQQVAILGVSFVEMVRILRDTWHTAQMLINDLVGATANVPPTPVQVAFKILSLILYCAYILLLILMLIRLFLLMVNNIIQKIKYKYAMKIHTLMTRACQSLGLAYSSTITGTGGAYANAVIMPVKNASLTGATFTDVFFGTNTTRKAYDDALNLNSPVPSYGYYDGTFWQLIQQLKELFNARCSIRNNTLYFERWDHWNLQAGITLPPISSEAPFEDPYGTNISELVSNFRIKHRQDASDFNTFDQYEGTSCQATFRPIVVTDPANVLLSGYKSVETAFALGKRKTQLTYPEKILGIIGNAINTLLAPLINIINSINNVTGSNFNPLGINTTLFGTRIGCLLLENDFTSVQKIMIVNPPDARGVSFLSPLNQSLTSAETFARNFHSASWFIDPNGSPANQYLTYKNKEIDLCCSDFLAIRDNNIITTHDQKPGRIDTVKWNPWTEKAIISYRVKEKFTNNLSLQLIVDGEA